MSSQSMEVLILRDGVRASSYFTNFVGGTPIMLLSQIYKFTLIEQYIIINTLIKQSSNIYMEYEGMTASG